MGRPRKIRTVLLQPEVAEIQVEPPKKDEINPNAEIITYEDALNQLATIFDTRSWKALLVFNRLIDSKIFMSLMSLDPHADATAMARVQGQRQGLYTLECQIQEEIKRRQEKENKLNGKPTEEDNLPTYQT